MQDILKGIRVVDFTTHIAAPLASRLMGDMGADVIKVESPKGDPMRVYGYKMEIPCCEEENPIWEIYSQNKRSVVLDLKTPEGKEAMLKLLETADVMLSNVRLGSLTRLGLDYETLHPLFPKLIWAHVSGYGTDGPEAARPGYDVVAYWSRGGFTSDQCPIGGTPMNNPFGVGDSCTSMAVYAGVLTALMKRQKTGVGERVRLSLYGMATYANNEMITSAQFGDTYPKDRYLPGVPLSGNYVCKDGRLITIHILDHERYWGALCDVLGFPEAYKTDPRFSTAGESQKPENNFVLSHLLEDAFAAQDSSYWVPRLMEADLAYELCLHYAEISKDPQALANRHFTPYTMNSGRTLMVPRCPIHIGDDELRLEGAPALGQHTDEVLESLGYSADQIRHMRDSGATL